MQWRTIFAFLIGCVMGAVALFLYLQGSGRLTPVINNNNSSSRVSAGTGAPPAAVPNSPAPTAQAASNKRAGTQDVWGPLRLRPWPTVAGIEKVSSRPLWQSRGAGGEASYSRRRGLRCSRRSDGKIARLFQRDGGIRF